MGRCLATILLAIFVLFFIENSISLPIDEHPLVEIIRVLPDGTKIEESIDVKNFSDGEIINTTKTLTTHNDNSTITKEVKIHLLPNGQKIEERIQIMTWNDNSTLNQTEITNTLSDGSRILKEYHEVYRYGGKVDTLKVIPVTVWRGEKSKQEEKDVEEEKEALDNNGDDDDKDDFEDYGYREMEGTPVTPIELVVSSDRLLEKSVLDLIYMHGEKWKNE
ncbi:uncharacterized protein LOC127281576 isoform X6 [Leptopilina boulardi]|uniref:uncharacterized protein LOC127281576 isoform X6 n=1 Tax=Leptopilina boulardi TaxID=63433 RepID=UPI0021F5D9F7|nr:uncharacterized protein LOC127281576 isoform X6 [Leptopilina boulardi]